MLDYFNDATEFVKRARRRLRIQFAAECFALCVTFAATARVIETDQPWWLLTLAFWLVSGWAVQTFRTMVRLDQANADVSKIEAMAHEAGNAVTLLKDLGIPEEMLRPFTGPGATPTTPDGGPITTTTEPAATPAAEPEPKA